MLQIVTDIISEGHVFKKTKINLTLNYEILDDVLIFSFDAEFVLKISDIIKLKNRKNLNATILNSDTFYNKINKYLDSFNVLYSLQADFNQADFKKINFLKNECCYKFT